MNRYFADISNNNTGHMNFEAYKKDGQHVLLGHKATEGTNFVDKFHRERCLRAHVAGCWVLHYHFARMGSSAASQARFFWSQIKPFMEAKDFACLDFEQASLMGNTVRAGAQWIVEFDHEFKRVSGHSLIGYCGESLLKDLIRAGASVAGDRWWIAAYGNNKPSIGGIKTWAWQFTDGDIGPQPHSFRGIGQSDGSILNRATYLRLLMSRPK